MNKDLLLVFIKNPVLGQVKTRLARTVGDEAALSIYQTLLRHTQEVCSTLSVDVAVFYSDQVEEDDEWWVKYKNVQVEGDLGLRMHQAFEWGFSKDYERVCIIGSDCYELRAEHIEAAFDSLRQNSVTLGPTEDGGYYLLGMTSLLSSLFHDKSWSTELVMNQTLADLKGLLIQPHILPTLSDIDREQDLPPELQRLIAH